MQLYPTQRAVHLGVAGAVVSGVGLVSGQAAMLAFGLATVVAVAIARAATLVSVARIRTAGFEMLWSSQQRFARISRGGEFIIDAEIRNRDTLAAKYVSLRPLASSMLSVEIDPVEGEVPASGRLNVKIKVSGNRVGRHGLFGLALEVRGAPGLYEVPLTFANPFGIEVMPSTYHKGLVSPRGGRSRLQAEGINDGRARGEGFDFRELREHQPGDPFKRIAWRASARRGKLVVREFDQDERDVVWIILDASVELWGGAVGTAPLDLLIDRVASVINAHLHRADQVGLVIVGARTLAWLPPDNNPKHGHKLHEAMAHLTGTYDADRSDWDESEVALRVYEHLRPLDPKGLSDMSRRDFDTLVRRAMNMLGKAPFTPPLPDGTSKREQRLRQYLAAFGIMSPARYEPDRPKTDLTIAQVLEKLLRIKPKVSCLYIASPPPLQIAEVVRIGIKKVQRKGAEIRWISPMMAPSVESIVDARPESMVLARAMVNGSKIARDRAEKGLRRLGINVLADHRKKARKTASEIVGTEG
jgi:uncharacterized protein (DUF58 family)